eukprot:MONOS_13320.1-p1 / transcript=MONOS_13320.1 / gene=MONOS_13320 / organism=Monocercomonoides_exilis_PA203 / gene_product=Rac1a, Rho family GTPase / transcript_product=Rac1a, Rho family GTPase / location=Mono_scaffold00808:10662-11688(+) / protein_length=180 / sequence_SO=supercontig / SO=protein_coding / is_pseudo=false
MSDYKKKLVIVGDGAVGKTCLLMVYAKGEFPKDYVPTVFDDYTCKVPVGQKMLALSLWDTAGQEDFDEIRPMSYPGTDIFLVCFSVDNRDTFENVKKKWVPELKAKGPKAPMVLLGTKCDLRETSPSTCIPPEECNRVAKEIGAVKYMECSAMKNIGVREAFEEVIKKMITSGGVCAIL